MDDPTYKGMLEKDIVKQWTDLHRKWSSKDYSKDGKKEREQALALFKKIEGYPIPRLRGTHAAYEVMLIMGLLKIQPPTQDGAEEYDEIMRVQDLVP